MALDLSSGTKAFQKSLRDEWVQAAGSNHRVIAYQRECQQRQLSNGQQDVRSELVLQALQQTVGRRTERKVDAIERYLLSARGLGFAASMPRPCLRRLCTAAELAIFGPDSQVFAEGEPAAKLHVVLVGSLWLQRAAAAEGGAAPEQTTQAVVDAGYVVDYEDFVRHHPRRISGRCKRP